jgi:predicted nuclease with RNAse H fold
MRAHVVASRSVLFVILLPLTLQVVGNAAQQARLDVSGALGSQQDQLIDQGGQLVEVDAPEETVARTDAFRLTDLLISRGTRLLPDDLVRDSLHVVVGKRSFSQRGRYLRDQILRPLEVAKSGVSPGRAEEASVFALLRSLDGGDMGVRTSR